MSYEKWNYPVDPTVRLQAAYRGHVVRDAVTTWKRECDALCVQAAWRMHMAVATAQRERGARKLQAAWRGCSVRMCELDPNLKTPRFQRFNLTKRSLLST